MTRAARPRPSSGSSDFGRALDRAAGARAVGGNTVGHLVDGPEVYEAMIARIDEAAYSIHFENYIIRDDATGERFADRLVAAARRGVEVRVLYDHFGSRSTSRAFWRRLRDAGVRVAAFNPTNPLRPIRSIRRDHRKYVGVDGTAAVVGGVCIGDEWDGDPEAGRMPWRDTAVEIHGPAVPVLELTFLRLWRDLTGESVTLAGRPRAESRGDAVIRVIDGIPGKLRLYRAIEFLVAGAAERIWITDAYLVALTPLFASVLATAHDGVDVRLLVPGRTDIPAVRVLTRVGYRELLEAGVRIWEWHGPMLHSKTVLVDRHWLKVGSSNLNPSSFLSNYELDVLVADAKVAAAAAREFRRDLSDAVEITLRPRRGPDRLTSRLPPAVVPMEPVPATPRTAARSALPHRTVATLQQVAGGARRSLAGAIVFGSAGAAVLLVVAPRLMAYSMAIVCFSLGALAGRQVLRRRRQRSSR